MAAIHSLSADGVSRAADFRFREGERDDLLSRAESRQQLLFLLGVANRMMACVDMLCTVKRLRTAEETLPNSSVSRP